MSLKALHLHNLALQHFVELMSLVSLYALRPLSSLLKPEGSKDYRFRFQFRLRPESFP